jgi:hypothetical protein
VFNFSSLFYLTSKIPYPTRTITDKPFYFHLFAVLLSAANVPLSDEKNTTETAATTPTTQNITVAVEPTKSAEIQIDSYENASVEGSDSADTLPPKVFPTDEEKILPTNETALKILQKVSSQTSEVSRVMMNHDESAPIR